MPERWNPYARDIGIVTTSKLYKEPALRAFGIPVVRIRALQAAVTNGENNHDHNNVVVLWKHCSSYAVDKAYSKGKALRTGKRQFDTNGETPPWLGVTDSVWHVRIGDKRYYLNQHEQDLRRFAALMRFYAQLGHDAFFESETGIELFRQGENGTPEEIEQFRVTVEVGEWNTSVDSETLARVVQGSPRCSGGLETVVALRRGFLLPRSGFIPITVSRVNGAGDQDIIAGTLIPGEKILMSGGLSLDVANNPGLTAFSLGILNPEW